MYDKSFGDALEALRAGKSVQRKIWLQPWDSMVVFQRPEDSLDVDFIEKVKSLPECVKNVIRKDSATTQVAFTSYLCAYQNREVVNGWLPSQSDLFATDWCILEY
jgi:hypothetical protein